MFKKILYPTDFSDVSKKALAYIMGMRGAGAEQVVVLRVIDQKRFDYIPQTTSWAGETEFLDNIKKQIERDAFEQTKPIKSKLKAVGFSVKLRVERGNPKLKILQVAREEDVSIIVLGSHGKSNIREMFLGSVSEHVIRHCKKPVLVIKR